MGGQSTAATGTARPRCLRAVAPFLEWEPRLMPRANAAQQDGYPARVVSRRDQQSRRPGACALVYSRTVQNERAIGRQRACRRTPLGGLDRGEWQ